MSKGLFSAMRGFPPGAVLALFLIPGAALALLLVMAGLELFAGEEPEVGATAVAALRSPSGDSMGSVRLTQMENGVLVMADVRGLPEGGHALVVHEVGSCAPDFGAAGDHFDPDNTKRGFMDLGGFVNPSWGRGSSVGTHGGDLGNIYASLDGRARADFFATGITLTRGVKGSVFDDDGSAVIAHEKTEGYGDEHEEEGEDTGARLGCGVVEGE